MTDTSLIDDMIAAAPTPNEGIINAKVAPNLPEETNPPGNPPTPSALPFEDLRPPPSEFGDGQTSSQTNGRVFGGVAFDPAIHEVDKNGNPRLKSDGTPRLKRGAKGGRSSQPIGDGQSPVDYRGMATFLCGIVFTSTQSVLGPQWEPTPDERKQIEDATANYARASNWTDLPPGIVLCVVLGLYAVPRLGHEETKKRVRALGEGMGLLRPKPKPKPVHNTAVPDQRNGTQPANPNPTIRNTRGQVLGEIIRSDLATPPDKQ